jgi:phosphoserine phosphatase
MSTLIFSDFSKTLTAPASKTTWSLFKESELFPKEYSIKRDLLFAKYHEFENIGNHEMVYEWFRKHLDLLNEYDGFSKIPNTVSVSLDRGYIFPREGLEEFIAFTKNSNVVLRIVSSGISEFIQYFLALYGANLSVGFPEKRSSGIYANDLLKHD